MTDELDPTIDLNDLMSRDPLDLSQQDLDKILTYQRRQRAAREGGARTKKATGEAPKIDIKALMAGSAAKPVVKAAPTPEPKFGEAAPKPAGGFQRRFL